MPNRIVREGIIDSARMESLVRDASWGAETFYRRLHSVADDYGRFDGRESVIRARCYPTLLDIVREADVQRWLAACEKSGLIRLYFASGQRYLEILDFRQQTRAKQSKYPNPENAEQMRSRCVADAQHMHTYTETETETGSETARTRANAPPDNRKGGKVRRLDVAQLDPHKAADVMTAKDHLRSTQAEVERMKEAHSGGDWTDQEKLEYKHLVQRKKALEGFLNGRAEVQQ